jgi:hypothetical protein
MPTEYRIGFWNLENLFDIENYPHRTDKLQRAIGKDLKGWTQALLDKKISQLASVICQMNGGKGPDLLGVCEVENEHVMGLLVQALASLDRKYKVAHHDTPDRRGIDVGFIYDDDLFDVEKSFYHVVMRRTATRDLLQVNFMTQHGRRFVVVGNHWPARIPEVLQTAVYRAIAGETLAYFHERILEVHGKDTPVLAMGDFNDEPFDRSLVAYALSTRGRTKVVNARSTPRFLNLMWPLMGQGVATHYYGNIPNVLDQFLANKNLLKQTAPIKVLPDSVAILRFPEMVDTGDYPKPIRFGGMGKPVDQSGFSDHFPIAVTVVEAD